MAPVRYPTFPETVQVPENCRLLETYPVVQPVLCHVPPLIVMVVPAIIPVEVVSIPTTVSVEVAVVSVTPACACKAPSKVIAEVRVSVAVAVPEMIFQCMFAVGVFSVQLPAILSVLLVVVIEPDDHVIVPVKYETAPETVTLPAKEMFILTL